MTFNKKVILLGSIAAALLAVFILGEIFSAERLNAAATEALLVPGFKQSEARRIELSDSRGKTLLSREGEWALEADGAFFPASKTHVSDLLQELSRLTRGTLVTRSEEAASSLGLRGADTVRLTVTGGTGETLCQLTAGKTGATGKGRYLRVGNGREVYETGDSLSPYITTDKRFWENLKIFPDGLKSDDIIRISVRSRLALSGTKGVRVLDYTLVKGQDQRGRPAWSFGGQAGSTADDAKVQSLVRSVLSLEGNDFDSSVGAATKLSSGPRATIILSTSDNRELTLFIGERVSGDQYPSALADGKYVYLAPEWRVEQALASRESLSPQAR
jgi:hypothetical protein